MKETSSADPKPNREALLPHAPLTEFYATPEARPGFVAALFDRAAPCYDRVSWLLAFGSDRRYRREALHRAGVRPGVKLLDVATGTGLVLQAALEIGLPARDLVGLDPSRGMLVENRSRRGVPLIQGLGERLPFADGAFDFAVMGYALRHVEDLRRFFTELHRVLKPRGCVLILEITRPASRLGRSLLGFHLSQVVPRLAHLTTGHGEATRLMQYYRATIEECVPPSAILLALAAAGFRNARRQTFGGILSDYAAVKEDSE